MTRMLVAALAALVGAATIGTAVASADTTPAPTPTPPIGAPSTLYKKNVRMDVSLQDTTALVFDASLDQVAASALPSFVKYLSTTLDGELFSVDATAAKCFVDDGTKTSAVTCQQVADLIDASADVVPATVLARAIPGAPLDFVAKKVIVHYDAAATAPVSQSAGITVSLSYADTDTTFDASLDSVADNVPSSLHTLLEKRLNGTFVLDASNAVCSIVTTGSTQRGPCVVVADLVNGSAGPVSATVLGKLTTAADGTSTFVAAKVVADGDSATSYDTTSSDSSSSSGDAGSGYGSSYGSNNGNDNSDYNSGSSSNGTGIGSGLQGGWWIAPLPPGGPSYGPRPYHHDN